MGENKRKGQTLPNVFNKEQLVKLFGAIEDTSVAMASLLAFSCGLRISECIHLRRQDINLKQCILKVVQGKGGKDRYLPLPPQIVPIIKKWYRLIGEREYFLPSGIYKNLASHESVIGDKLKKALKKAKLLIKIGKNSIGKPMYKYHFHSLRHTACSFMIARGVPLPMVQRFMGHSRVLTTMRYTHIFDNDLIEYTNKAFTSDMKGPTQQVKPINLVQQPTAQNPVGVLQLKLINNEISSKEYKQKLALLSQPQNNYIG